MERCRRDESLEHLSLTDWMSRFRNTSQRIIKIFSYVNQIFMILLSDKKWKKFDNVLSSTVWFDLFRRRRCAGCHLNWNCLIELKKFSLSCLVKTKF